MQCMHGWMDVCSNVFIFKGKCVCIYIYTYIQIYVYIYNIYIYIYAFIYLYLSLNYVHISTHTYTSRRIFHCPTIVSKLRFRQSKIVLFWFKNAAWLFFDFYCGFDKPYGTSVVKTERSEQANFCSPISAHQLSPCHACLLQRVFVAIFPPPLVRPCVSKQHCLESVISSGSSTDPHRP